MSSTADHFWYIGEETLRLIFSAICLSLTILTVMFFRGPNPTVDAPTTYAERRVAEIASIRAEIAAIAACPCDRSTTAQSLRPLFGRLRFLERTLAQSKGQ